MKKTLCAILTLSLLLSLWGGSILPTAAQASGGAIVFGDAVLEAKVRAALNKPEGDIIAEDAASLTWLDVQADKDAPQDARIQDIRALQAFVNLTGLNLNNNNVHDISVLKSLTGLQQLWLCGNPVDDLSPLGSLTGLNRLGFDGQFRELPFLANLTGLEELNIGACRVLLQELLQLKKLKIFCAPGGELADISLLAQIPTLTAVDVSWNLVSDLSPLKGLPLVELYIAGDPITDFSPIREIVPNLVGMDFDALMVNADSVPEEPLTIADANLEKALRDAMNIHDRPITLRDVYITQKLNIYVADGSGKPFSDITPLAAFTNLYALNIDDNRVSDLSPLAGLTKLNWFSARNNKITDLTPLASLPAINAVFLEGNPIADVSPLAGMAALKVLYLDQRPTCDYAPLDAILPTLQETNLTVVPVDVPADPLPIADTNLEVLLRQSMGIQGRPITLRDAYRITDIQLGVETMWQSVSDISALQYFPNLERLAIFGSQVSDLSPLMGLSKLNRLIVDDSAITDLTPLAGMKQLGYLELKGNRITDVTPLSGLTQLGGLDISNNQIADFSPLYSLKMLNVLRISNNLATDASGFRDIAGGMKDKDFDPDQPVETADAVATQAGEGNKEAALKEPLQPKEPDAPISFKDSNFEQAVRAILNIQDRPLTQADACAATVLDFAAVAGGDAKLKDISPLQYFVNLEELRFSGNGIKDVKPLAGLTRLTKLQLDMQSIADITPLQGLTSLEFLSIKENKITKIDALAGMAVLRTLDLTGNKIKDVSALANDTALEELFISKNAIADAAPIGKLALIHTLDVSQNKLKDASPLAGLENLRILLLGGNKIKDFSSLATLARQLEQKDFDAE